MTPGTLNLTIQQGATFQQTLTWSNPNSTGGAGTPIDLTGCSAEMSIATQPGEPASYTINSVTPTPNGGLIVLGATAGTIQINIPWQDTLDLPNGVYDLAILMSDGKTLNRIVTGSVSVLPEVTQWQTP